MLKKSNYFIAGLVLLGVAATGLPRQANADTEPRAVVEAFHEALVQIMQAADFSGRFSLIDPVIDRHFDTFTIARISLGSNWRKIGRAHV